MSPARFYLTSKRFHICPEFHHREILEKAVWNTKNTNSAELSGFFCAQNHPQLDFSSKQAAGTLTGSR